VDGPDAKVWEHSDDRDAVKAGSDEDHIVWHRRTGAGAKSLPQASGARATLATKLRRSIGASKE